MIYTVSIKDDSIRFDPLTEAHAWMLAALVRVCQACAVTLEVTCAREGHPQSDPHTRGQALDLSVTHLSAPMIVRVYAQLQEILGPAWTVLLETPDPIDPVREPQLVRIATLNRGATARHLHIQPRIGTVWPPVAPVVAVRA